MSAAGVNGLQCFWCVCLSLMVFVVCVAHLSVVLPFCSCSSNSSFSLSPPANVLLHPLLLSFLSARSWPCVIWGSGGQAPRSARQDEQHHLQRRRKDTLAANHSSKPLPSVPEERKRNKIISIFSGAEKGAYRSLYNTTPGSKRLSSRSRESRQTPEIHLQLICVQTLLLSLELFFVICIYLLICLFHIQGCYPKTKLEKIFITWNKIPGNIIWTCFIVI